MVGWGSEFLRFLVTGVFEDSSTFASIANALLAWSKTLAELAKFA
jgi:hypothetical protein